MTSPLSDSHGNFGPSTRAAVEAFQRQRGLRIDGIVGRHTWATLVEAGLSLGDRLLYRAHPLLRGDDVADLQTRLCSLGFDTGRVDGIYGDNTTHAVAEFQRNLKLPVDGIAGRITIEELARMSSHRDNPALVTTVREQANRRNTKASLPGTRIGLISSPGLATVASATTRTLSTAGADVIAITGVNESEQAQQANDHHVDLVVSIHLGTQARVAHYRSYSYESVEGQELSALLATALDTVADLNTMSEGMYLALLRETAMVAVVIELAPLDKVVEHAEEIAQAIALATTAWAAGPSAATSEI